jgi:hypothetical protein
MRKGEPGKSRKFLWLVAFRFKTNSIGNPVKMLKKTEGLKEEPLTKLAIRKLLGFKFRGKYLSDQKILVEMPRDNMEPTIICRAPVLIDPTQTDIYQLERNEQAIYAFLTHLDSGDSLNIWRVKQDIHSYWIINDNPKYGQWWMIDPGHHMYRHDIALISFSFTGLKEKMDRLAFERHNEVIGKVFGAFRKF